MTLAEFHENLRQSGCYRTPPEHQPRRRSRAGMLAGIRFYFGGLGAVVLRGASEVRHGTFDDRTLATLAYMLLRSAERLGTEVTFDGFEVMDDIQGPVVYAGNHMSLVETIVLPAGLMAFGGLSIVARESLAHYPLFGRTLRASRSILVSRSNPRQDLVDVLKQGTEHLEQGRSVLLFPQGTRSASFDPHLFNTLGAKLAYRAGVPLIPVAVKTDFARPGRWLRDFGPVDPSLPVRFAATAPLPPGTSARDRHAACTAFIAKRLRDWGLPPVSSTPDTLPPAADPERDRNGDVT